MAVLKRTTDSAHGDANVVIGAKDNALIYNINADKNIRYHLATGQFFMLEGTKATPIFMKKGIPSFQNRDGDTEPTPSEARSFIKDFRGLGEKSIHRAIEKCRSMKPFREQLQLPMTPLETQTCRKQLEQLRSLTVCYEKKNCDDVFRQVREATHPNYSFVGLFESNTSPSDPTVRVGTTLTVTSVGTWTASGIVVAQRAQITATAARMGVNSSTVFGLLASLLWSAKPLIAGLLYSNSCGNQSLRSSHGVAATDCIGQDSRSLESAFSADILKAIDNPNAFFADAASRPNGLMSRLACYVFEAKVNQWKQDILSYSRFTCQGRTLNFTNGNSYLIGEDNHLYRHENMERTFHFYPQSLIVEQRSNGARQEAQLLNEYLASLKRRVRAPTPQHVIPETVRLERSLLQGFAADYGSMISGGQCRPDAVQEPIQIDK